MGEMKTIVISLGGSVLVPSLESNNIAAYAGMLSRLAEQFRVFVVVGGGGEARRYISAARTLAIDEATSDEIGILVTRLNATMLISALGQAAYPVVPASHYEALEAATSGRIVVMGGVTPGQTTDAVSAVLAERTGADLLINATSVDGIYSADPKKDPDAKKLDHLSPEELLAIVQGGRMDAGANNVIDLVAAKIVQRNTIPLLVIDGKHPDSITSALFEGVFTGTLISRDKDSVLPLR
jgi:uridylate kinase